MLSYRLHTAIAPLFTPAVLDTCFCTIQLSRSCGEGFNGASRAPCPNGKARPRWRYPFISPPTGLVAQTRDTGATCSPKYHQICYRGQACIRVAATAAPHERFTMDEGCLLLHRELSVCCLVEQCINRSNFASIYTLSPSVFSMCM